MRAQMEDLVANELWESAETLGGMLLAASSSPTHADCGDHARDLALFADALYGKREHRRALHYYRQALQLNRLAPLNGGGHAQRVGAGHMEHDVGASTPKAAPSMHSPETPATPAQTRRRQQQQQQQLTGGTRHGGDDRSLVTPGAGACGGVTTNLEEAPVKFKMGRCLLALKEWRAALAELETIPARSRTVPITLTLARTYQRTGYERAAVACYKECLRVCPHALEAITALTQLGVRGDELRGMLPPAAQRAAAADEAADMGDGAEPMDGDDGDGGEGGGGGRERGSDEAGGWLWHLAGGHAAFQSQDHAAAASHFDALDRRFPGNLHAALHGAKTAAARGDHHAALAAFQRCRAADQHCVTGMDAYAELLYEHFGGQDEGGDGEAKGAGMLGGFGVLSAGFSVGPRGPSPELNQLTHDLLNTDNNRPESWVAAAMYWESRGESARALGYAERALRLDDHHVASHVIKGQLCLRLKRAENAVGAFKRALHLSPSMRSYAGLVAGYLLLRRHKEALSAAKEALRLMPDSAIALALLGDVHSKQPEGLDRARRSYEQALKLDPTLVGVVLALADVHVSQGRADAAQTLLRRHMETHVSDDVSAQVLLHCKLGAVLASSKSLSDALGQYQTALGLFPNSEEARQGLNRVERMMKGQDPDAPEDEEEQDEDEDDDGEGDDGVDDESDFLG